MSESKKNTNPRYPTYCQTHFTAGDDEQFERYRKKYIGYAEEVKYNVFSNNEVWRKYHNLNCQSVSNTFNYLFHKFKKGIFIQIKDNDVSVMLPFSKYNYTNEWHNNIGINPDKYESMEAFFQHVYNIDGRVFKKRHVNKFINQWYGNNGIMRYEYPLCENDSGIPEISDMFKELCRNRQVPDIEFFVNKRDHPIIRRDGTEVYDYMFGDGVPLVSHNYDTYAPVLSMCGGDEYADVRIPTWDDWDRVSECKNDTIINWTDKRPTAVFRGASTGFGLTFSDNMRLKVSLMSLDGVIDDGELLLDAGITKWNVRPRKIKNTRFIDTFDDDVLKLPLVDYMPLQEQKQYKYIINIDGHVSAYRLSRELGSGCVVLMVASKYKLWYSDLLEPYIHYVPVMADLSDLYDQIIWCKEHDEECFNIATNAVQFYNDVLGKDGILTYLEITLKQLKNATGTYEYKKSPLDIQYEEEKMIVSNPEIPEIPDLPDPTGAIPNLPPLYGRSFELLQGVQWYLSKSTDEVLQDTTIMPIITKNSRITIHSFSGLNIMKKHNHNVQELVHEAMIGLHCVNSLLKSIPNFSYTFGMFDDVLYTEYFSECITLFEYLNSNVFDPTTLTDILLQIALSLHVAQQQFLFVHYDLYPWNVVLKKYNTPIDVYYLVDSEQVKYTKITTKIVPVIVDYGKSRAVINGKYYGLIKPYDESTIHDVLCILISCMHQLLDGRKMSHKELRYIFHLSTFFSGTKYTNNKQFNNVRDLKQFLSTNKKFSQMISTPKFELESKTPLDFVHFLRSTKLTYPIEIKWTMRCGTSRHVYDYLNCRTDEERINTYKNIIRHDTHDEVVLSQWNRSIKSMFPMFSMHNIQPPPLVKFKVANGTIITDCTVEIDYATKSYDVEVFNDADRLKYLSRIFSKMKTLPSDTINIKHDVVEYVASQILHPDIADIIKSYKSILKIDSVKYLRYIANKNTFEYMCNHI